MSEEMVRYEQPGELTPDQVRGQVQKIQRLMSEAMQDGEHFGVIPGTKGKPTLLKPGAEKLCLMFRMDPEYEILRAVEEPNRIHYVVKCILHHITTGNRIASGLGSCNNWESKYRYRKAERVCPKCGAASIIKGKEEYGGGWLCWKKKNGCGVKFSDGDHDIESQEQGQIENPDPWDQANTILKMASKRALVAAVLNGTAASDIFTQDLEDMPLDSVTPQANPAQVSPKETGELVPPTEEQEKTLREIVDDKEWGAIQHQKNGPTLAKAAQLILDHGGIASQIEAVIEFAGKVRPKYRLTPDQEDAIDHFLAMPESKITKAPAGGRGKALSFYSVLERVKKSPRDKDQVEAVLAAARDALGGDASKDASITESVMLEPFEEIPF